MTGKPADCGLVGAEGPGCEPGDCCCVFEGSGPALDAWPMRYARRQEDKERLPIRTTVSNNINRYFNLSLHSLLDIILQVSETANQYGWIVTYQSLFFVSMWAQL